MNERNKKILDKAEEIHKECLIRAKKNLTESGILQISPSDSPRYNEEVIASANTLFINVMKCIPSSELLRD